MYDVKASPSRDQTAPPPCPPFCQDHFTDDGGEMHQSAEHRVFVSDRTFLVSVERYDPAGFIGEVRIDFVSRSLFSNGDPFTVGLGELSREEALSLARALTDAVAEAGAR